MPRSSTDVRLQDRFAWEWRRIRRSLGKSEREELIRSFERYNNNLASFVQNTEILAPHSDGRGEGFVKYLDLVRSQACGLHSILGNSWKCACHTQHKAYLRLQHPFEAKFSQPTFGVAFPSRQTATVGPEAEADEEEQALWNHTFISISKVEPQAFAIEPSSGFPLPTPMPQNQQRSVNFSSSVSVASREKKTSKVRFTKLTKTGMNAPKIVTLDPPAGITQCSHSKLCRKAYIVQFPFPYKPMFVRQPSHYAVPYVQERQTRKTLGTSSMPPKIR